MNIDGRMEAEDTTDLGYDEELSFPDGSKANLESIP